VLDTPIARVAGLSDQDRIALENRNLLSTGMLWKALARNEGLIATLGLDPIATTRVRAALSAQAKRESEAMTRNLFVDHLADLIILGLIGAVIAVFVFAEHRRVVIASTPFVVAAKPIDPFHVIDATDLEVHQSAAGDAAKQAAASLYIGRYPMAHVPVGERLDAAKVSSGMRLTHELNGLRIFAVKIRSTSLLTGVPTPFKLDLFLSPHSLDDRGRSQPFAVYVLDLKPEGDSLNAVVASTDDNSMTLLSAQLAGDLVALGPVQ
jgi:hypothetical protein